MQSRLTELRQVTGSFTRRSSVSTCMERTAPVPSLCHDFGLAAKSGRVRVSTFGFLLSVGLTIDDIITPLDGQFLCCYTMYIRAASEGRGSLRFSLRSPPPDVQQFSRLWGVLGSSRVRAGSRFGRVSGSGKRSARSARDFGGLRSAGLLGHRRSCIYT
jgi:hypothetical protein